MTLQNWDNPHSLDHPSLVPWVLMRSHPKSKGTISAAIVVDYGLATIVPYVRTDPLREIASWLTLQASEEI